MLKLRTNHANWPNPGECVKENHLVFTHRVLTRPGKHGILMGTGPGNPGEIVEFHVLVQKGKVLLCGCKCKAKSSGSQEK